MTDEELLDRADNITELRNELRAIDALLAIEGRIVAFYAQKLDGMSGEELDALCRQGIGMVRADILASLRHRIQGE